MAPFGFSNRKRFKRRLEAIPKHVKQSQIETIGAAAEELAAAQRRGVNRVSGKLQDSIRAEDVSTPDRIAFTVSAGGPTTTKTIGQRSYTDEISIGQGKRTQGFSKLAGGLRVTYDYALAQEFGTARGPAQPFFWPPYRAKKRAFKSRANRAAKKAILKGASTS